MRRERPRQRDSARASAPPTLQMRRAGRNLRPDLASPRSNVANSAPSGDRTRCNASASSMPCPTALSATATAPALSTRTFGSPSNPRKASTTPDALNAYTDSSTHAASRSTVTPIHISLDSDRRRAVAPCCTSSLTSSRTTTFVSTEITPGYRLAARLCLRATVARIPAPMPSRDFASPVWGTEPNTWSIPVGVKGTRWRNRTPSGVNSTENSVPAAQPCASRTDLGRKTWPFDESFVVSIGSR